MNIHQTKKSRHPTIHSSGRENKECVPVFVLHPNPFGNDGENNKSQHSRVCRTTLAVVFPRGVPTTHNNNNNKRCGMRRGAAFLFYLIGGECSIEGQREGMFLTVECARGFPRITRIKSLFSN
mmetsp:Transcript_31327/g.72114  ORF Transcript_31327/g.72114 Transcript_31327/m.72114 type:complete len:123 (+) Transcript_31327:750-1118(+)